MPINRLLTAAATVALAASLAAGASAQTTATAKTEAQAKAATGKASTDAPAGTAVQGTAKAVKEGAAPAATAPAATATVSAGPGIAAQGDLVDTLRLSGKFTTFLKGVDSTNLTGLLKNTKTLTVFAPTDVAFAAMPPAELAALQANKAAMQKFILHHVINAPIPSTKIKGAKGPVPSGAGDQVVLDGSDAAGALKADGATIVQADLQTTSGLVHVVDHVLVAGSVSAAATAPSGTAVPAAAKAPAPK